MVVPSLESGWCVCTRSETKADCHTLNRFIFTGIYRSAVFALNLLYWTDYFGDFRVLDCLELPTTRIY